MTQTIQSSKEILMGTSFSYLSKKAVEVLEANGAQISGESCSWQVDFPQGTTYEQNEQDHDIYRFFLPCGCRLRYVAKSLMGVNYNSRTRLILHVEGRICPQHDGQSVDPRSALGTYRVDALESYSTV